MVSAARWASKRVLSLRDYGEIMIIKTSTILELKAMNCPSEICRHLKSLDIRSYAYSFWTFDGIIKNGESADNSEAYGERIYRQAAWLPGWHTEPCSSSGAEMMVIAKEWEKKHKRILHKDSVWIKVFDTTHEVDPKIAGINIERYLIDECIKFTGRAPLGNKDPKTRMTVMQTRNQQRLDVLFETDTQ